MDEKKSMELTKEQGERMERMVKEVKELSENCKRTEQDYARAKERMSRFNMKGEIINDIYIIFDEKMPIYVWGDEFKAEEVFTNYLSNAITHCSGEKKINVIIQKKDDRIRVSVFNTGELIPEESIEHLFEKFYKIDKARTREYGGSGIGLSIVKAIQDSIGQGYGVINRDDGVEFWFEMEQAQTA